MLKTCSTFDLDERIKCEKKRKKTENEIAKIYTNTNLAPGPVLVYTKEMIREYERRIKEESPK
jgi:hypothetical protein